MPVCEYIFLYHYHIHYHPFHESDQQGYLSRGADNYESALRVLENQERSLQLATVYQRLGWNMLQQARNLDANRYFQKSLAISLVSGEEFKPVSLQSMSSMGVSLTQLGKFDDSERYHFACLKQRLKKLGENHPSIGACYNNIGVMYDQKGDAENAFKYYKKGLEVKLKSKAPVMSIVFSLSNAANMSSSMGNYREAHRLIDDALMRLTEEKIPPREALACTYDTKGKIYLQEEKFIEAEEMFQKAVDVREEIAENMPYLESLVHLADANRRSGNFERSLSIAKKGLKLKTKATASMPLNTLIAECLACIADVYGRTNNIEKHRETLEKIESELLRLEQVYLCQCNEKGLEKIRNQLKDVKDKLDNAPD
ncbi:kinesin light chain 4-like [Mercenaria mercenaria]|uniref:kinesin light chain 4-like n=1 Tax=Mercenaria mercenaria TaxID=6596 RepID=UPI00234F2A61|nr:kinesin light chain 4-like [Mercenaria mercenaria]